MYNRRIFFFFSQH